MVQQHPTSDGAMPDQKDHEIIILGIDPGLGVTGFGCIHYQNKVMKLLEFGTIKPKASLSLADRLEHIGTQLNEVFVRCKPDVCSIEDVFVMNFARPALNLAHARGVCFYIASQNCCPPIVYTTRFVKKTVCGYGNATKDQVIYMVRHLLSYNQPIPHDAADALALSICHATHHTYNRRLEAQLP